MPYTTALLALTIVASTALAAHPAQHVPPPAPIVTQIESTPTRTIPVDLVAHTQAASKINQAVTIAMKQRGVKYKWGGASPSGFDCSGLVYYSFNKAGIPMPRTSGAQSKRGVTVSRNQIQPGDLLHYPGHVAIAIGNGKLLESSKPGKPVATRAIYGKPKVKRVR